MSNIDKLHEIERLRFKISKQKELIDYYGTMSKLSKCEPVGLEVLAKICYCLKCNIQDVVEFIYEK